MDGTSSASRFHAAVDVPGKSPVPGAAGNPCTCVVAPRHGENSRTRSLFARLCAEERGSTLVEFAFIFQILYYLLLSTLQFGLVLMAKGVADTAAWSAARAAAVYIPLQENRRPYENTASGGYVYEAGAVGDFQREGWDIEPAGCIGTTAGASAKWRQIHWAAASTCAAAISTGMTRDLETALGGGEFQGFLSDNARVLNDQVETLLLFYGAGGGTYLDEEALRRRLAAATLLTQVSIEGGTTGLADKPGQYFREGEIITVRVRFAFPMVIPFAASLFGTRAAVEKPLGFPPVWLSGAVQPASATDRKRAPLEGYYVSVVEGICAVPCEADR